MAEMPLAEHNNMVTIPSDRTDNPVCTENSDSHVVVMQPAEDCL